MKRRFKVIIEKKGEMFRAHTPDVLDVEVIGETKEDALEKLKTALREKLGPNEDSEE